MIEDEELINEHQYLQLNQTRQSELISKHCSGIEKLIRDAKSKEKAEQIANKACDKFESECASSIVRMALSQYLQAKVMQYWGKE